MNAIKLGLLFIFLFFLPTGLQTSWSFYSDLFNDEAHMEIRSIKYFIDMSPVIISLILFSLPANKLENLFPQKNDLINANIEYFARITVFGLVLFYAALIFYKASSLAYIVVESAIAGIDNSQIIAGMSIEIISSFIIIFVGMKYSKSLIQRFFEEHA